ncbi:MAG: DUF4384 domain-containing protein [Cyclobacteriaceae bacterium]|nr:DUF4384 domain-containing protein [Cyclobacteriaceae bacterium]MCH8516524.1 DUF4384 domain-containing protein [Cyclobacteriaceae bacterium]
MRQKSKLFLLFFVFVAFSACAQRPIKVSNLEVEVSLQDDLSLRQAIRKGEQELRLQALRKAGIAENISSYESLMNFERGDNLQQVFTSDIITDVQGTVSELEILAVERFINIADEFAVRLRANASVMPTKGERDPNFRIQVEGIRSVYQSGDHLQLQLTSTINSKAQLFLINESNEALRLYPNSFERSELVPAQQTIRFPRRSINYTLFTENQSEEYFRLILLVTKEELKLPFANSDQSSAPEKISAQSLLSWIYQLNASERSIHLQTIKLLAP